MRQGFLDTDESLIKPRRSVHGRYFPHPPFPWTVVGFTSQDGYLSLSGLCSSSSSYLEVLETPAPRTGTMATLCLWHCQSSRLPWLAKTVLPDPRVNHKLIQSFPAFPFSSLTPSPAHPHVALLLAGCVTFNRPSNLSEL